MQLSQQVQPVDRAPAPQALMPRGKIKPQRELRLWCFYGEIR
ncbi:hypothetical protein C4K18_2606 [Pseudomonas chlororaphis subsp. aurantiaca]|nr:hypothetical protein C4K18_2606 [Pseudomonas chlororaphis subsp. aurantiaca]